MIQEILNHQQIEQKINRLAHQIIENTFDEAVIYIGGISGNGLKLAELLRTVLLVHTTQQIIPFHITMNKEEPVNHPITLSIPADHTKDACIILVDDVLNSGKTMQEIKSLNANENIFSAPTTARAIQIFNTVSNRVKSLDQSFYKLF